MADDIVAELDPIADEFVCADCGCTVYSLPPREPPPTRCATCAYLNEFIADPVEREELRRRLMIDERSS